MAWGPGRSLRDNLDRKASASYMLTGKNEERPNGNAGRAICLLTGCYGSYNGFYFLYFFIFNFLNKFIYLFLAMLGLHCCACSFSSRGEQGYSSLWCTGFSLRWLLLLRSTGSRRIGFSSCSTWAQ